jgi:hypothetical protein
MLSEPKFHSQEKKPTMKPTEFAATRTLLLLAMYPAARSRSSTSRKNKVKNKTQELRIAAMVYITVRMNHAQQYMAND